MAARNPFASSVPDFFDPYAAVQSRRAPRLSTGYYFIRNLLLVGAIAGGFVAAYRNDVFRDLARKMGQEQRYLDAEKYLVGSPGWGTPRSMEPVLKEAEGAEAASITAAPAGTEASPAALAATGSGASATETPATTADAPVAAPTPVATAATATPEPVAAAPSPEPRPAAPPEPAAPARRVVASDSLAPVSLDSLPVLNKGSTALPAVAASKPVAPAPTHVAAAAPVARAAVAAPAPRPAPVDHGRAKAIKVTLDEDAPAPAARNSPFVRHDAPKPAPVAEKPAPKPAPVAEKPEPPKSKSSDVHAGDNPLLAAVRGAVRTHPAKNSVPPAQ